MENDDDSTSTGGKLKSIGVVKRELGEMVGPVSPGGTGEGLPYAPVNWPTHGDIWAWRVGYRFSKVGIFQDRFLRVPKRLQKKPTKSVELHSKRAVERYLRSEFPDKNISAFFASFTWNIPIKPELIGKYVHSPLIRRSSPKKKLIKNKQKNRENVVLKSKQKALKMQKYEKSNDNDGGINLYVNMGALHGKETPGASSSKGLAQVYEEFNEYLNSLDEILDSPHPMQQQISSSSKAVMADTRKKLSSLLAMGTPNCLISSESVKELVALSYQLQNDPNLTMEEHSVLKLIQSIPFTSKSFLESKETSSKADEFAIGLNLKIASTVSMKEEYNASKMEMEYLKAEEASRLLDIMELDEEISNLKKIRQEKREEIKGNNEKLNVLNSIQERVMGNLPYVVNDIQLAKSEKSIWELKKSKAEEEEAQILARYAPLDGFSF